MSTPTGTSGLSTLGAPASVATQAPTPTTVSSPAPSAGVMSQMGKLGQNAPAQMTPGVSKLGAGGAGPGPTAPASPFGQGFAGATSAQAGNPNLGGFSGGSAEMTNPGMGFLSGLLSGSN